MKSRWMLAAALTLGVSSLIPTVARADDWRRDRDDRYVDARYRDNDWRRDRYEADRRYDRGHDRGHDHGRRYVQEFDVDVPLRDVPRSAIEAVRHETRGRRIEAVQYVFRDGKYFYRFRMDDPRPGDHDVNVRVTPGGRILTIEEARTCDPRFGHRH